MYFWQRIMRWLSGANPRELREEHGPFIDLNKAVICLNPHRRYQVGDALAVGVCTGCSPGCLYPVRSLWSRFYASAHQRVAREYGKQKAKVSTVAPEINQAAYLTAPESRLKH